MNLLKGIIPARAGFTRSRAHPAHLEGDHPRSRGVYDPVDEPGLVLEGSSPLARGLQRRERWIEITWGIIPARAGFTRLTEWQSEWDRDHPRSRGVYCRRSSARWGSCGSSPLARGLPQQVAAALAARRIIPARAGFTTPTSGRTGSRSDHPRSRGVYLTTVRRLVPVIGSSPLARGLLAARWQHEDGIRIIPARAGFTAKGEREMDRRGSSPLARGLRPGEERVRRRMGIIPARAGFTCRGSLTGRRRWDHPRSRGVYVTNGPFAETVGGSSPLARGLLVGPLRELRRRRIIPARAGFTRLPRR